MLYLNETRFSSYHKFGAASSIVAIDNRANPQTEVTASSMTLAAQAEITTANPNQRTKKAEPTVPANNTKAPLTSSASAQKQESPTQSQQVPEKPLVPTSSDAASRTAATISKTVRRVVVDVVVENSHGQPVTGLQQQDFRIFEDGKPQEIRSFSISGSGAPEDAAQPQPNPPGVSRLTATTFTNFSPVPDDAPLNIILWDTIILGGLPHTQVDYTAQMLSARLQVINFLRNKPAHARYAIFVLTNADLKMLQGFTDDANQLVAAMQRPDTINVGPWHGSSAFPMAFDSRAAEAREWLSTQATLRFDQRLEQTARAHQFQQLALILSGLPGRKNVLWLTSSMPWYGDDSPWTELAATLTPSRVSLYPIDWRGLQTNPMFDVATNQSPESKFQDLLAQPILGQGPGVTTPAVWLAQLNAAFSFDEAGRSALLRVMADETGGEAFYATDIANAMAKATSEGSLCYTLTYSPSNSNFHGELRHIRVELQPNDRGYHLAYRRKYFATEVGVPEAGWDERRPDSFAFAGQHCAPPQQGVVFTVRLEAVGEASPATVAQMKELEPFRAKLVEKETTDTRPGPAMLQEYVLHYNVPSKYVELASAADGTHHVALDFAVIAYDVDGQPLNGLRTQMRGVISREQYVRVLDNGIETIQRLAVPVQAASLRLVVRDEASNRIGATEMPLPLRGAP